MIILMIGIAIIWLCYMFPVDVILPRTRLELLWKFFMPMFFFLVWFVENSNWFSFSLTTIDRVCFCADQMHIAALLLLLSLFGILQRKNVAKRTGGIGYNRLHQRPQQQQFENERGLSPTVSWTWTVGCLNLCRCILKSSSSLSFLASAYIMASIASFSV